MKIIGTAEGGKHICEVEHSELEKYLGLYYGKLKRDDVRPGAVIDLGKGYDHASEIKAAMKATQDLIKTHDRVVQAIINGMRIVSIDDNEAQS